MVTETPTIQESRRPVYCSQCGRKIVLVRTDRWEQDMNSEAELVCKCGKRYTLAEYRLRGVT